MDIRSLLQTAVAAYQRDDFVEAERLSRQALAADERSADAHHLLALVEARRGRPWLALQSYDRAVALRPTDPALLSNRAVALDELGRYDEALAGCDAALRLRPDFAPTLANRGNALRGLSRLDEAAASYDKAVALDPGNADCHFSRSLLLLLHGDFAEGWREYEWRRKVAGWPARRFDFPEWQAEPLAGRRLLLCAEQGLGDTIQFARFARLLAARGADIVLEAQPPLAALVQSLNEPRCTVVRQGEPLPACDFHLPLMSVPFALQLEEAQIPAAVPYLQADPSRVAAWSARLGGHGFRVGVAWQGDPRRKIDVGRSIPLAAFAPLARIPGVRLISLQKHDGLEQLAALPPGMAVETLGPEFDAGPDGFLDAAAVIMNLDLVVTSDNTIAHLAGALGRPVWIVLKQVPDWRWMRNRADSPWYPTARLFRQSRRDDWDAVFASVAEAAAVVVPQQKPPSPARVGPSAASVAGDATMPGYVISLARRPDRRQRFLDWNGSRGIELHVLDAVDGRSLRQQELIAQSIITDGLGFSSGALGNAMSHRTLWETCIARDRPIMVFEDDAYLPGNMRDWLASVMTELASGCDILYMGYNRNAIVSLGYDGQWCNIAFEQPTPPFAALIAAHACGRERSAHTICDARLVWGTLGYAVSPSGARRLLDECFPLSDKVPVRMYGSGRLLVPYALDGIMNVAIQRGAVRARAIFPPLVIGPNEHSDSDVVGHLPQPQSAGAA